MFLSINTINTMSHLQCPYCGMFYLMNEQPLCHDEHENNCAVPLPQFDAYISHEEFADAIECYTCGKKGNIFTNSQMKKSIIRCIDCVSKNVKERFQKYHKIPTINDELHDAVSNHDLENVKKLLSKGANPNHVRHNYIYYKNKNVYTYFSDGTEEPDDSLNQPTTPLKLVVFRICDCTLNDNDIDEFAQIAKVLLEAGADKNQAMIYAKYIGCDDFFNSLL